MNKIFLCVFLWLVALNGIAQTRINGRVVDSLNSNGLPGATVVLTGTRVGTFTDLNGNFSLYISEPSETINLTINYIGYNTKSISIKISENKNHVIFLSETVETMDEVIVNGNAQGQAQALNQQKSADNVINVVSSDQIGRFPDPNAAEALQRVPGVNIERDQGEGRYVLVRGLAPQFTNININGEQIPSPEADVRFVALDAIPSDQLASMEISKTLTPDMDGDAIGGSVNLITRTAQSSKTEIKASALWGYNNLMVRNNLQGSFQIGKRFLKNEKLGILLNASYYSNELGSDNWERDTRGNLKDVAEHRLELRDYELTRTRLGLSSTIDYKFNQNHSVYFRTLYSRFTDREWRRRIVFLPADDEIERLTKDRFESQSILNFNLGTKHNFGKVKLDLEASYSLAEQNTPYDNEVVFVASGISQQLNFNNNKFPTFSTSENYLESGLYDFNEFVNGNTKATDQNITSKFNLIIPYSANGYIKTGAKIRLKTKSYNINENVYEEIAGVPNLSRFAGGLNDENFLNNNYTLGLSPNLNLFIPYFNSNPSQFELDIEEKLVKEAVEAYEATENVYAGYLMARHQFKKLMILGGVRYEFTQVNYKSKDVIFNSNGDLQEIRPIEGSNNYGYFLPQIQAKYELKNNSQLRFGATYSYARPNFSQIIPAQEANLEDQVAVIGNAELTPVSARNLDLMYEKYFSNVGILQGGIFYKNLTDFIYTRRFTGNYPLNSTNPIASNLLIIQEQNGQSANLLGFEIALQRKLTKLPSFLKYLQVYANYTYTYSNAKFQRSDAPELENIKLPGQTTHLGNLSLAYEKGRFSARISANFNGTYLTEIGASKDDDIYVNRRIQLDASVSYVVSKNWRVFGEFLNLTNQPFETYSGNSNNFTQREFYSWWSRIGIKLDLNK